MKNNKNLCRVCSSALSNKAILELFDMPKSAQSFLSEDMLYSDKGDDLKVYQCNGCGLIQLNSEPVSYYKDVIRASAYSPEMKEFRLKQFKNFLYQYNLNEKKILEIGCGRGEYLSLMSKYSDKTYGIEHLEESVSICKESNLHVSQAYIEDKDYKHTDAPFDGFYILNFLEHIPDINTLLQGLLNNLTSDAIGLIEVPNFDMILKNNLFSEFISDHLYYFTQDSLKRTLEINGFEILECKTIWYDYIISAVVQRRKNLDLSNFYKHQNKLKEELHTYIDTYKNVAIWGAGHQALAVISLTKIKDKILFIIDSAPFKQNLYTPSSHLKIVSPETLNTSNIDAIIVMAASYSDEVAKIIKSDFPDIDVSILRDYGLEYQ